MFGNLLKMIELILGNQARLPHNLHLAPQRDHTKAQYSCRALLQVKGQEANAPTLVATREACSPHEGDSNPSGFLDVLLARRAEA